MRILVLCTDAYGGHGGIALYTRDLIEALAAHRSVEKVVAIPRIIRGPLEPIPPNVTFVVSAARNLAAYMRAVARAAREPWDLVVCAHVNLLPVARMLRRKTVLWIYGIEAWKPTRRGRALVRGVDAVVSISEITCERFLNWSGYPGRCFLVPNAIHLERYGIRPRSAVLTARWSLHGKRVLLTLGRIVAAERYKGFDEVVEVLPSLPDDVVYLAAGSGSDLSRLVKKARDLGVADRVVFTGHIDEGDKTDVYNLADVYVMPSRGEGFGFVFLEALACGVPVIGSRHDGGREALRDGELGLLVDPSNLAEVRTAILDLLADPRREIPPGLGHFAFPNFQSRVHSTLDELLP
ncbi:MAG TPA: glycosyltransferase family 4 protein [Thermoanaerobaculia bacterium]|nr:glycosyltransferase family 4 protein [Thermoanaerobaculia bacterium]